MSTKIRSLVLGLCLLLLLTPTLFAEPLANFDRSSLLGYRLGMSLPEAEKIRPFAEIRSHPPGAQETTGSLVGITSDLTLDGIPLQCYVTFEKGRITKVAASFEIADFIKLKWLLDKELGAGEEETTAKQVAGSMVARTTIRWKLADALVELSVFPQTSKKGTLFLTTKTREP